MNEKDDLEAVGGEPGGADATGRPLVSCVIVCYHRPEGLRQMVKMLSDHRVEVVVVNAEIDPDVAEIASACVHVPLEGDPGFATGVNLGARHASAEYVVFLNDDLEIDVATVLALRDEVASGAADVALPAVLDADGRREATIRPLPTPRALAREWLFLPDAPVPAVERRLRVEKWRRPEGPEPVEAAGTPAAAVRTELLRRIPLPEDYFLYWDEIEWFWRLREAGKRAVYYPELNARHMGGRKDVSAFKSRLISRNAVRCVRRTQGRRRSRQAFAVMLAYNLRLVAISGLRRALGREGAGDELRARLAGLDAMRDAVKEAR